jgi:Na+/phosphate symporter
MKINKKEILQQQEYNRLYEVLDQDTQWGVEHIMELEDKVKSLKGTIKNYKFEIASYRLLLNNNN